MQKSAVIVLLLLLQRRYLLAVWLTWQLRLLLGSLLALVQVLNPGLTRLLLHPSLERRVEVVLDVVVRAAMQKASDLGPAIAVLLV
jgi:hypothetical protein